MASEAQIRANQINGPKSRGPKSPETKAISRANSFKHGLTGAGVVLPEREAVEVERRSAAFLAELQPSGEVGAAMARHAAKMSVRMERCTEHENVAMTDRARLAEAEFVPPEGVDEAEANRLRVEAGKLSLFDASPAATLARKYEAAAERSFFRALKELRQHEARLGAASADELSEELGSFLPDDLTDEEFDKLCDEVTLPRPRKPVATAAPVDYADLNGRVDVPFTIGKRR